MDPGPEGKIIEIQISNTAYFVKIINSLVLSNSLDQKNILIFTIGLFVHEEYFCSFVDPHPEAKLTLIRV